MKVFIVGAGHGGMIRGQYVTAPKKMFKHSDTDIAYEGVLMRNVINKVMAKAQVYGLPIYNLTDTQLDIDLDLRVNIVNEFAREYGSQSILYMPHHANGGKGTGFEIYTSPGDTPADPFAKLYGEMFNEAFPDIKWRKKYSDGAWEADKEKPFYELKNTKCPTILPEWSFFDNIKDWEYMKQARNQDAYAEMICQFMSQVLTLNM